LKSLVEDTYSKNNNTKVHLMGHSLGAPLASSFLVEYVSLEWKDNYIASLIPIGPPLAGSTLSVVRAFSGYNYGIPMMPDHTFLPILRESGTPAAMFPKGDAPVLVTNIGNYTATNLPQFFRDIRDDKYYSILQRALKHDFTLPPNVPVHCIYGLGYPTATKFQIKDVKQTKFDILEYGDGDGTVPAYSLQACDHFAKLQDQVKYPVDVTRVAKNSSHTEIIYNPDVFELILDFISN
jgi:pimeloyl-ACP methyl ester carboxylesterase